MRERRAKPMVLMDTCRMCRRRVPYTELHTQRGVLVCRWCTDEHNPRHPEDD